MQKSSDYQKIKIAVSTLCCQNIEVRGGFFYYLVFLMFLVSCGVKQGPATTATTNINNAGSVVRIWSWKVLGPFSRSYRDASIDYLRDYGGESKIEPLANQVFYSKAAKEGILKWKDFDAGQGTLKFDLVPEGEDLARSVFGRSAVFSTAYAFSRFDSTRAGVFKIRTQHVSEFYINGVRYEGEPYTRNYNEVSVPLKMGKNKVLLKLKVAGSLEFYFKILERGIDPIQFVEDFTSPDIIRSDLQKSYWLGIPLENRSGADIKELVLSVEAGGFFKSTQIKLPHDLLDGGILKYPVGLERDPAYVLPDSDHLIQSFKLFHEEKLVSKYDLKLRLRSRDQSHRETFLSQWDRSVQYYAIKYPKNYDSQKPYSLIVGLHGANVEADVAIDTYGQKDWAFVVAPTNRRPYGHGWEGLGQKDLEEVQALVLKKYPIHKDKIILAGHSMGGHGAWSIASRYPSRYAGLAPSAGWSMLDWYVPPLFDVENSLLSPEVTQVLARRKILDHTPFFFQNLKEVPIFATNATEDTIVTPFHMRYFLERAKNLDYQMKVREIDTNEHWCQEPRSPGGGHHCVDHQEQWDYLQDQKRSDYPKSFSAKFFDLEEGRDFYWVKITSQNKIFQQTWLKASWSAVGLELETKNVQAMTVTIPPTLRKKKNLILTWNGKTTVQKPSKNGRIPLGNVDVAVRARGMESVFYRPYLIVYASQGSDLENQFFKQSALLLGRSLWRHGNTYVPILRDDQVSESQLKKFNLILIGQVWNHIQLNQSQKTLPLRFFPKGVSLRGHEYAGGYASVFVYPSPYHIKNRILVLTGSDLSSIDSLLRSFEITRQLGTRLPEWILFDEGLSDNFWSGIHSLGFFSKNWDLSNKDYYWGGRD